MELSDITTPALAYLGDSVLEVCVRTYLVTERGLSTSAHLNRASLDFVRPTASDWAENRRATGMEVLFGYLHLTGQTERLDHLFRLGYGLNPDTPDTIQTGE